MRTKNIIKILFISLISLSACKTIEKANNKILEISLNKLSNNENLTISFFKGESYNHPSFVLWIENLNGDYIKTLYVTKSYASGIFGYELVGDSIWKRNPGPSLQPAALPYWTYKKGLIEDKYLIPTPEHPYIDAYTGATPKENFQIKSKFDLNKKYKLMLEINQSWDWNKYWTNNKFPKSKAYSHSSQPSIIYSVEINNKQNTFYMNPIGHGSPTGEDGNLYTDLSTLTTAKNIFKMIKVEKSK